MEDILNRNIPKGLRYVLALTIIPLASPVVVSMVQDVTAISSSTLNPILITLLTLAYAWCIWTIRNSYKYGLTPEQESAYQLEALNEHSIVTIANEQGELIFVNDKFLQTTGYQREDLLGYPTHILYPENELAAYQDVRNTVLSGQRWCGDVRLKGKDGGDIWTHTTVVPQIDKQGNVTGSISIRTDITKMKIDSAEKNMRRALHILHDEVYMFEPDTLRFIYLNQAAMKRCGWTETAYLQKTLMDKLIKFNGHDGKDANSFHRRAAPLLAGEVDEITYEITTNGRPNEVKLQLVHPEGGKPNFIGMVSDISERRAFEKNKDDFISTVSHELRTPVTSIKGALGLILAGATGTLNDKAKEMLSIAYRNTDRLVLMINDILDLEKIAAGRMEFNLEPVKMAKLLQDAIAANKAYADRFGVSFSGAGLEQDIQGLCDSDRIFQVMNNLLSNAAKFSKPNGEVIISLSETDDSVMISVEDFGDGIPEAAQADIFDRFIQADASDHREKGGTGLGLSIVKALIESQGGTIGFVSQVGKGTKFSFVLPKSVDRAKNVPNADIQIAAE